MTEKKKSKLDQILDKLSNHDKRFDDHDKKFDRVFDKLLSHDREFENLRSEAAASRNDVMGGLDKVMGELEKAREDRVFAKGKDGEQDRRIEGLEGRVQRVEARAGGV